MLAAMLVQKRSAVAFPVQLLAQGLLGRPMVGRGAGLDEALQSANRLQPSRPASQPAAASRPCLCQERPASVWHRACGHGRIKARSLKAGAL